MIPGYLDLEFPLLERLTDELVKEFATLTPAIMAEDNLDQIPNDAQGVYELFHADQLVYIGKTDADAGLGKRLRRHCRKLQHRHGTSPKEVIYKAIKLYTFTAMDLESELIKRHGGTSKVPWNGSGFGSNDPGKERDTTTYKDGHFDKMFPIDIDRPLNLDFSECVSVGDVLIKLKGHVPYTIRYATAGRTRQPHGDLTNTPSIEIVGRQTCRSILKTVIPQLSKGWRLIALPSHMVLYNDKRDYKSGELVACGMS